MNSFSAYWQSGLHVGPTVLAPTTQTLPVGHSALLEHAPKRIQRETQAGGPSTVGWQKTGALAQSLGRRGLLQVAGQQVLPQSVVLVGHSHTQVSGFWT